jgi:phage tail tube protein FII
MMNSLGIGIPNMHFKQMQEDQKVAISELVATIDRIRENNGATGSAYDERTTGERVMTGEQKLDNFMAEANAILTAAYTVFSRELANANKKANFNQELEPAPTVEIPKLTRLEEFKAGWMQAMADIKAEYDKTMGDLIYVGKTAGREVAEAFGNTFNTFFVDVIEGRLQSFKDYLLSFLKDIGMAASKMTSQYITGTAVSAISTYFGGGGQTFSDTNAPGAYSGNMHLTSTNYLGTDFSTPKVGTGTVLRQKSGFSVNIQNNTGTDIRDNQVSVQQDTSGMVMNVVLDNISRNKGGSRDTLRGLLAT